MRILGFALFITLATSVAVTATESASLETQIQAPATQPHWDGIYAKAFPGCGGTGSFIPARIVVVPREGEARTMAYNDATVAKIGATWNNDNPGDDIYTIGRCAK